ncbi:MAG: trigger factor [Planctomycetota bacterium]
MDIQVEDVGACRKRLQVKVPVERIKAHIDEMYKWANQNVRMRGFRPGKVPRKVLEQKLGSQLMSDAKQSLVEETFREVLREQTLDVVGTPRIEVGEAPLASDEEFGYSVELDVRPEVEVGDVATIEIEARPTEPTDDDVDNALQQLADNRRKIATVDGVVEEGDFVKADLAYRLGDEVLVEKQGLQIHTKVPIAGTDPEEYTHKLVGLEAGAEAVLPITYPENFEKEPARGQKGELSIKVCEVLRFQSPPIDDELAKGYEFDTLDAMRTELRTRIGEQKEASEHFRREQEILDKLFAEHPFELPEGLVQEETKHRLHHMGHDLEQKGMPKDQVEQRVEQARPEVEEEARLGVRNLFLVDAIGKKEKLFVTEGEVEARLRRIAEENQATYDQVRNWFEENRQLPELRLDLLNRKVRDFLRQKARMTDSE